MKYLFVGFNAVAIVIVGWVLTELSQSQQSSQPVSVSPGSLPEVRPVSDAENAQFATAESALENLESLMAARRNVDVNSLLATASRPDPAPAAQQISERDNDAQIPFPQRRLTLLLDGQSQMAMIDGELVRSGDMLPGGGRVVRIDNSMAVIRERGGGIQTLRLPKEQMRLGTLRSSNDASY